jgi:hypothetical protein
MKRKTVQFNDNLIKDNRDKILKQISYKDDFDYFMDTSSCQYRS